MVWTNPITPATPQDSDPASEGALEFRVLKAALAERLGSRMPGWPDTDPLPILAVDVGALADRPTTPAGEGHVYISDDPAPKRFYYGKSGAWQELTFGTSAIADNVLVVTGSDAGVTIPGSTTLHIHSVPVTGWTSAYEAIGWRYRWRCPVISSDFTAWNASDPRAQIDLPFPLVPELTLEAFRLNQGSKNIDWRFNNEDTDPLDVDLEWVITLLKVG